MYDGSNIKILYFNMTSTSKEWEKKYKMKWLIVFSPLLELAITAGVAKFWAEDFKEIAPIIILQFLLYTFLITPILLWGFYFR